MISNNVISCNGGRKSPHVYIIKRNCFPSLSQPPTPISTAICCNCSSTGMLFFFSFFFLVLILSDSLLFQTYFSSLNKPKLVRLSPDLNEENRISFYFPPHPIMLALQVSETQFRDWFYPSLLLLLLLYFLAAIGHSFGEKVFYEFNCISPPRKNLVWETSFILRHNHLTVNDHNFCSKKNKKKIYM